MSKIRIIGLALVILGLVLVGLYFWPKLTSSQEQSISSPTPSVAIKLIETPTITISITPTPTSVSSPVPALITSPSPTQIPGETMTLKIYFANSQKNPGQDCQLVFPLDRRVPKTLGVARAALNELFKGPTQEEKNQGYYSFFSEKTKSILKNIKIVEEICYVDLEDIRSLIPNASSSCGSAELLAEMETTLKQFSTIKKSIFAINGDPKTFYDWLQIGCSAENNFCDKKPFE